MKVSIVIPIYNVEKYIERCLFSCINQTYKDLEIICVNDGSPDNSSEIIDRFVENDSRVVHYKKSNEGLCLARKSGVEVATGNYIFHLDGDDYLPNNAIEDLLSFAINENLDIVKGCLDFVSEDDSLIRVFRFNAKGVLSADEFTTQMFSCKFWTLAGSLIRKEIYGNNIVALKEVVSGEDLISLLQLATYSNRLGFVDNCVYYYVKHETSIMATRRVLPIEGRISFITTIFDIQQRIKGSISNELYLLLSEALIEAAVNISRQYKLRTSKLDRVNTVINTLLNDELKTHLLKNNRELYLNYRVSELSPTLLPTWLKFSYKFNSIFK
ncbi:MAG: glycosyltransferase family 2 protein [Bacteroidales bacterium]